TEGIIMDMNEAEGYKKVFSKGFVVDYPLTLMDGKLTDVLFNGSIYKDDRGNVVGAVVVARDITEQKRIAKSKAELATEIAINAQKEYLMAIKMSGDALIVLINDILDLAKVDAG
uniref:PAC domain-containing protein n=1 Tax=Hucho hucho TaxID=62062 RepID=A0A4W5L8A0_9TELE